MRSYLVLLGALVVAGCAGNSNNAEEPPRVCTMIGCNNGLSVVISGPQRDYTVTVKSGGTVLHSFTCRANEPCQGFVENQTPASVTVDVTSSAGTVSRSFTPEYRMNRPNGPDCPPECRQATVTVAMT